MPGINLTREEAVQRAETVSVDSYDVLSWILRIIRRLLRRAPRFVSRPRPV